MLTGDSWAETVSRPGVFTARDGFWVATYYVSFVLLTQLVLINVVVAVLLTGFDDYEEDEGLTLAEKLTALLESERVELLDVFETWDCDGSGAVSRVEFLRALLALGYRGDNELLHHLFNAVDSRGAGEIRADDLRAVVYGHARRSHVRAAEKRTAKEEVVALRAELQEVNTRIEEQMEEMGQLLDVVKDLVERNSPPEHNWRGGEKRDDDPTGGGPAGSEPTSGETRHRQLALAPRFPRLSPRQVPPRQLPPSAAAHGQTNLAGTEGGKSTARPRDTPSSPRQHVVDVEEAALREEKPVYRAAVPSPSAESEPAEPGAAIQAVLTRHDSERLGAEGSGERAGERGVAGGLRGALRWLSLT